MIGRRVPIATMMIVILVSAPAWANPRSTPDLTGLLPAVILLGLVSYVLPALAGVYDVYRRLFPNGRGYAIEGLGGFFVLLMVLVSTAPDSGSLLFPVLLLGIVTFSFARSVQMLTWGLVALTKARPVHLAGVHPGRMILSGIVLLAMIPASFVLCHRLFPKDRPYGRIVRAASELRNAEQALARLGADAGVSDLHNLFIEPNLLLRPTLAETVEHQTDVVSELLARGRSAMVGIKPELREKLQSSYMRLPKDPWGRRYLFFLGPWKDDLQWNYMTVPFRLWRAARLDDVPPRPDAYTANGTRFRVGLPASPNLPVYIFSCGGNRQNNQVFGSDKDLDSERRNGWDDINNWDAEAGWHSFYDDW